ncbi:MAG: coniferyl aldehyde dehydrogenase [Xanthomonadales bacterium]|nr:coniferyl aldehyde dehydrogenase [Xanthomonadales bacterium]
MTENPGELPPGADLAAQLTAMRKAQVLDPLPAWEARAERLRALERLIREHRAEIAAAISADFGNRPAAETDLLEVFPSLSGIRHALRHGRRWMRPRRGFADAWFLPARTELRPRPLGVIGIIVPWNYPLYLAAGPLTDALAAGNRAMLKMSEATPRFSALFAGLIARHFPHGEIVVVQGDAAVGRAFAALPFDHLLFTGSTAVGRAVMGAAAANLTPVTLELGGKSPAIIGPGARLANAAERILFGKLMNAGQTCIAPDYVLLPRARMDEFIALARATAARMYPDFARNRDYASIASDRHYARLARLRDEAMAAGASAHALAEGADPASRRLAPTLLTGVDDSMAVMQEEIFGPLLPLLPYDDIAGAIEVVRSRPHPLAMYVFEEDASTVDRLLAALPAGGVCVNETLLHIAQHGLPFGGIGESGMGAYHGEAGFRTLSKLTPIFRQSRLNVMGWLNPPHGARFRGVLKLLLGR